VLDSCWPHLLIPLFHSALSLVVFRCLESRGRGSTFCPRSSAWVSSSACPSPVHSRVDLACLVAPVPVCLSVFPFRSGCRLAHCFTLLEPHAVCPLNTILSPYAHLFICSCLLCRDAQELPVPHDRHLCHQGAKCFLASLVVCAMWRDCSPF
jgi:hypothetical protein